MHVPLSSPRVPAETQAYLVGGGIASLSAACLLIRDAKVSPTNIHIIGRDHVFGGAMDGSGEAAKGYMVRGGRMLNMSYVCLYDLLKTIPTMEDSDKSIYQEILDFNVKIKTDAHARLVDRNGNKVDVSHMGFNNAERLGLVELWGTSEMTLGRKTIANAVDPAFFSTNFWSMWATTFAFQPWHSAIEFKRYLHRFIQEFSRINTLSGVDRTVYNQFDSIILPIVRWLEHQGVDFIDSATVTDIDFVLDLEKVTAQRIHLLTEGAEHEIKVDPTDLVFVTNGSMVSASTIGTMTAAPTVADTSDPTSTDPAWSLWSRIASKLGPEFSGYPENFVNRVRESEWESFTVTMTDPVLLDLIVAFSGNDPGTGALVTFRDSAWLMSIVVPHQPHFRNQPKDISVFWGYALLVNKPGDHIKKPMAACTGAEILEELLFHLRLLDRLPAILPSVNLLPCMLPYITSQFLTRGPGDRPRVVPTGSTNFAWLGQWTEIPGDTVFTVEYSVRSAMLAVDELMALRKRPQPTYKGDHHVDVLYGAMKAIMT